MTLTPVAERLALELSLPVFTTWVSRVFNSNMQSSACGVDALTDVPPPQHCSVVAYNVTYFSHKIIEKQVEKNHVFWYWRINVTRYFASFFDLNLDMTKTS